MQKYYKRPNYLIIIYLRLSWAVLLFLTYYYISVFSLPVVSSITKKQPKSYKEVKVSRYKLIKVLYTLDSRAYNYFLVLISGILK